jgi:superfamily II DNA or RNA helicase
MREIEVLTMWRADSAMIRPSTNKKSGVACISEGLDVPFWEVLIIASPISSEIKLLK